MDKITLFIFADGPLRKQAVLLASWDVMCSLWSSPRDHATMALPQSPRRAEREETWGPSFKYILPVVEVQLPYN